VQRGVVLLCTAVASRMNAEESAVCGVELARRITPGETGAALCLYVGVTVA
jgi:hypothetical protein